MPLGPIPDWLHDALRDHWALTDRRLSDLPLYFDSLESRHFSGLQVMAAPLAEIFAQAGGDKVELVQVPNLWSCPDHGRIADPYFMVNLYRACPTIDLDRSGAMKVVNPRFAHGYSVAGLGDRSIRILSRIACDHPVWRDSHTSDWFCTAAFRARLEAAAPGEYMFVELSAA